jgi:anti-anti-sigma regulatory factor
MVRIEGNTLQLRGEATVHGAETLREQLSRALAPVSGPVLVDTGSLEALDVLGAQVLLAWRASLEPGRLHFTGWPPPILTFLKTSGLAAHFA